jgi:DNA-binding transcriptional MerR regulator
MRISELADSSGVSVPTIKYYLREGLLPPGEKVTGRLADYGERHVRRLRLLRALREVGGISVEALRGLVDAVADRSSSVHEMFGAASDALAQAAGRRTDPPKSLDLAGRIIERAGWTNVQPEASERKHLEELLEVIASFSGPVDPDSLERYLTWADAIAEFEVGAFLDPRQDRETLMEQMVVGQVVYGELLLSLRRLAQQQHSSRRFGRSSCR